MTSPKWLNKKNIDEWQWACKYLRERWPERLHFDRYVGLRNFEDLVHSIHTLENYVEGVKLIERLRGNLRQRRYRASRSQCSVALPRSTKSTLKRLARSYKGSETAVIQHLIEEEDQRVQGKKREKTIGVLLKSASRDVHKRAQEEDKIRMEETKKQLRSYLEKLVLWEILMGTDLPEPSPDEKGKAVALTEQRMRIIEEAITASVEEHRLESSKFI